MNSDLRYLDLFMMVPPSIVEVKGPAKNMTLVGRTQEHLVFGTEENKNLVLGLFRISL
jgi:hypothetical protein